MKTLKQCLIASAVANCLITPHSLAATIEVNTNSDALADNNACTLRDAIRSANGLAPLGKCLESMDDQDVIVFKPFVNRPTLTLENGPLTISSNLTVQGPSSQTLTIDANLSSQLFDIAAGEVTLQNLTLNGGSASTNGGCIDITTSQKVTLTNIAVSTCRADSGGGGLFISSSTPSVEIGSSRFDQNSATLGGGILSSGTRVSLTSSFVSLNSASRGAGIFVREGLSSTQIEINESSITENSSTSSGGGIYSYFSTLTLIDSTVSRNNARYGGGIHCYRSSCNAIDTQLESNIAYLNSNNGSGGAIDLLYSSLTMTGGKIRKNTAALSGGGVRISSYSTVSINGEADIKYNDARRGGAFAFASIGGNLLIENASVTGNTSSDRGGAINIASYDNTITINNSTISKNTALKGGAISNNGENRIYLNAAQLNNNSASGSSSDADGGAFYLSSGKLNIINSTLKSNTATNEGGAFHLKNGASLDLLKSHIGDSLSYGSGGVAYSDQSLINIEQSSIVGNSASNETGGLFLYESELTISNTTLSGNSAPGGGGAIALYGSNSMNIRNATIVDNNGAAGAISGTVPNEEISFIANSVIAGNSLPQCDQAWPSGLSNWSEDQSCFGNALGDPLLDALELVNTTYVRKPASNSPLIGAASTRFCQNAPVRGVDQLDREREPENCTIGAFESLVPTFFFYIPTKNGKGAVIAL